MFGYLVHAVGPDLHLYPLSLLRHEGDMQCLVSVGFGVAHPVAQAVGMALVYLA